MSASPAELISISLNDVFGERDFARRRAALERTFADDVLFQDHEETITGHAALNAKVDALYAGAPPDWAFQPLTPAAEIGDLGRISWGFGPAGAPVVQGMDIVLVSEGRIAKLYTFVDVVPA